LFLFDLDSEFLDSFLGEKKMDDGGLVYEQMVFAICVSFVIFDFGYDGEFWVSVLNEDYGVLMVKNDDEQFLGLFE
jgi:hypothetical protein